MQNLFKLNILPKVKGWSSSLWLRVVQATLLFVVLFFTVSIGILPAQYSLEAGEISPETIYAPRTVVDHAATSLARQHAAEAVADVFLRDATVEDEVIAKVTDVISFLIAIDRTDREADEIAEEISSGEYGEYLDYSTALALLAISQETLEQSIVVVSNLISDVLSDGVKENEVEGSVQQITNELFQTSLPPALTNVLVNQVQTYFEPNMLYSQESTEANRRQARDQVEEIRILRGAKIVDRGEAITEEQIAQLQALGLLQTSFAYGYYLGIAGLLLCIFGAWAWYLYQLRPEILHSSSKIMLIASVILICLWTAKIFSPNFIEALNAPLLIPASLAAFLFTIIFDVNLALFFGSSLSLIIALMVGNEMSVLTVSLVSNIVAAYSVTQVNQRSDLTRAGLLVAGANVFVILGLILTGEGLGPTSVSIQRTLLEMSMGAGSGILAAVLAIGLLPFFENTFGITTSVRLLELANPNQRPLKRLLLEAPGTYHHSILVGNLAEAAAEAVGADPVLARVGAYYHDIGKLSRPYFFIENQFQGSNPHDKIPPSLSSMILTAHVKAGVELASQYKLPPVIKDIIQQHHGDTLIGFFYHRAMAERGSKDQLLEDKFRYEGPKPQFKEAGIIMLADCVEAAVRSLSQANQFRIQSMVTKIVQDKLSDGQLDQCDLTLRDLNLISEAFVRVLTGIYHKRIAYPTEQDLAKIGS